MSNENNSSHQQTLGLRHIRFSLWALFGFMGLGLFLEYLLGFKSAMYLGMDSEVRRLMWRLAHAHGTLTALLHLGYGLIVYTLPAWASRRRRLVSKCLMLGTILLPGGFFLGGFGAVNGDPGIGVFLAPVGAAFFLLAAFLAACDVTFRRDNEDAPTDSEHPVSPSDADGELTPPKDNWSA